MIWKLRRQGRANLHYVLLVFWVLVSASIFLWVFVSAFKSNQEISRDPFVFPEEFFANGIRNFGIAWFDVNVNTYFVNSLIVALATVVFMILISAPAAYVLARIAFRGRNLLTGYFVAGMGLPYQLILIPYYVLMAGLGLTNSLMGLVVTYIVLQFPFSTLLLIGFFRTLPSELEDQAAIDGTSEFGIFWRIMFPLASPGIITTIIFNFVWIWKEFLMAQTLIQDDAYRTLPVGLLNINHSMRYTGDWASLFAAVVIIIVPVFVAYFFISRRVMSGLTLGVSK